MQATGSTVNSWRRYQPNNAFQALGSERVREMVDGHGGNTAAHR